MGMDFEMGYFALVRALILDRFRLARRRRLFPVLFAGLPFPLLAACSSAPRVTYDLTPAEGIAARAGRGQLAVLLPDATLPADSDRIVVRTNPQSKIFVHCHWGADRSGVMVATYRIAEEHWTVEQAVAEMHAFHLHFWLPHLKHYVADFPNRLETSPELHAAVAH